MALIRNTNTGDNFLEKVKTNADISALSAIQLYEKQLGNEGSLSNTVYSIKTGQYFVGTHTLMVFINGQKAEEISTPIDATQYKETNSTTITFGDSLLDTDVIEFIVAGAYKVESLTNINADNMTMSISGLDNLSANGIRVKLNVFENNVGFGACLGVDSTSGFLIEATGDSTSTLSCRFLALDSGIGNKDVLIQGVIRNDLWSFSPGSTLYLSNVSGEITEIRNTDIGEIDQILGFAIQSNIIYFNPDTTYITLG